jgi:UDP-N-acetylglucosamine--N-acetylmuramyl-(pentapeptide) pyrophosphoryl-undecaprenol N-acetylglucosamine transferase
MDLAYAIADVVVSRAGAMAISELAVVEKPVIFVPLPTAAEDHQTKNAKRLVEAGAAQLISNQGAEQTLVPGIVELINSPERATQMAENIGKFAQPDAAENIVKVIKEIVKK